MQSKLKLQGSWVRSARYQQAWPGVGLSIPLLAFCMHMQFSARSPRVARSSNFYHAALPRSVRCWAAQAERNLHLELQELDASLVRI